MLEYAAVRARQRDKAMERDLARCLSLLSDKGKGKDTDKGKGKGKFNWGQRLVDNGGYKGKPLVGCKGKPLVGGNWVVGKGGATASDVDLEESSSNTWGARV